VPLLIILVLVAGGAFSRRRQFGEIMTSVLLWVGVFGVVLVGYTYRDDLLTVASRVVGELRPGVAMVDAEGGSVMFRRGLGGHFQVNAEIDGTSIPLIFDTGASAVVLSANDAARIGIDTANLRYNVPVSTANGTGRAASVRLDSVAVGAITRTGIRAFVAEPGALETSLLGMTFLETLSRYSVSADSLELVD